MYLYAIKIFLYAYSHSTCRRVTKATHFAAELALKISEKLDKGTSVSAVDMDIVSFIVYL